MFPGCSVGLGLSERLKTPSQTVYLPQLGVMYIIAPPQLQSRRCN